MIELTERACEVLGGLLREKAASDTAGLRLAVRKGGCAGWQYEMQVGEAEQGDVVVEKGGVRVIVAADSVDRLSGSEVDYSDDLTDAGFKIENPRARRSCGCGTSFEPDDEPEGALEVPDGEACGGGEG